MTVDSPYRALGAGIALGIKRNIFVSYHHGGDQAFYDIFSRVFSDSYEMIFDNSLERKVDSDDSEYVMRQIRENYIAGTSCTVLLVGRDTWGRKFVDWEIAATLDKQHGLLGFQLPTLPIVDGRVTVPDRFLDNTNSGYAVWKKWDYLMANHGMLSLWIEEANAKSKAMIQNSRERRSRNNIG